MYLVDPLLSLAPHRHGRGDMTLKNRPVLIVVIHFLPSWHFGLFHMHSLKVIVA